jgi:hypothetical protein
MAEEEKLRVYDTYHKDFKVGDLEVRKTDAATWGQVREMLKRLAISEESGRRYVRRRGGR